MLGSSLGYSPCRRCAASLDDTGSKWLEELSPLLVFPLTYSALQQLSKCHGGREEKSLSPDGEKSRGKDKIVIK